MLATNMYHLLPLLIVLLVSLTSNNSSTTLFATKAFLTSSSSSSSSFSRSSSSRITATSMFDTDATTATTTEELQDTTTTNNNNNNNLLQSIPRIKASEFDPNIHYFRRHRRSNTKDEYDYYETPVIIENVLSLNECEEYTDELINEYGQIDITLQRKQKRTTGSSAETEEETETEIATDMYYCTFLEAIKLIVSNQESHNHNDSLLAFCEGLSSSSSSSSSSC